MSRAGKNRWSCWVGLGVNRSLLLGVAAAVAIAVVYVIFFRPSDEGRIRERLDQLAEAVRIDEEELSPLPRAARIRSAFMEIFTEDARATVAELDETLEGRQAIGLTATELRGAYQSAYVSFDNTKVRIDGKVAKVSATATVTGALSGRAPSREELRVSLELSKADGDWRIVSAVVEPK